MHSEIYLSLESEENSIINTVTMIFSCKTVNNTIKSYKKYVCICTYQTASCGIFSRKAHDYMERSILINSSDSGLISVKRLTHEVKAMKAKLKRRYRSICLDGAKTDDESFFADNYHTVSVNIDFLINYSPDAVVSRELPLAKRVLAADDTSIPDTDDIIMRIRDFAHSQKLYCQDVEHIKYTVTLLIIRQIYSCVFGGQSGMVRFVSLLCDISSLDTESIISTANPVAIALCNDKIYSDCDSKTKLCYREQIYKMSKKQGTQPQELANELILRSKSRGVDLSELLFSDTDACGRTVSAGFSAAIEVFISFAVSLAVSVGISEAWTFFILFIPTLGAVKSLIDSVLIKTARHRPLLRLNPQCDAVADTKCAIVLSAAVNSHEQADALYDRLYRLHASNPQKSIKITALCDLSPEQVAVTGDDRSVTQSIAEVIDRLNDEVSKGTFSGVVRKRSYSKTQDEYMGRERKRGAIADLVKFMLSGEKVFFAELGDVDGLIGIKYICAVDFDTEPYMDSVTELLAAALHPINKPYISGERVVKGYGVIVPRMVTRLDESMLTGFARNMGGIGSLSSYDTQSIDINQQVYATTNFGGKGLIDCEAMQKCTSWLPDEKILSHDILEGELIRAAYAGDIIFTEGFPKSPISYFKRLDRWIRGDVQNLRFLMSSRFGLISKLKLLDNLLRAVLPVSVLTALYFGFIIYPEASGVLAAWAMGMYLFPQLLGLIRTVFYQGIRTRHFFSGLISQTAQSLTSLIYSVILLPTVAVKSARAVITAVSRMISGKRLLEWTTSAQQDLASNEPISCFFVSELAALGLCFSQSHIIRLFGVIFSLMPLLMATATYKKDTETKKLSYRDTRLISAQIADMWRFYSDYVTESENHLPPDNVQFAPVYKICHRTSPTNIGMYLLSVLAACDSKLISVQNMYKRLSLTLSSVERMEKYSGNLYNWYETKTLELSPNPYVSSVDSGNFIVSLVTLKEGLKEYSGRCPELAVVIKRIDRLINGCDLSIFYDSVKGLMAIGIDPSTGKTDRSRYDNLMSESRLGSFYAIASRQVPKTHWLRLQRTSVSCLFYSGAASYSGTMFEYFMPEIFMKSPENSLINESLKYALWCQRRYASSLNRPYGISESGYYSFDPSLSYSYMAHGVPKTGLRRGLESDYVVSPYSTYLSLGYAPKEGMENLNRLKSYGMYSRYGFYEALDFTYPEGGKEPEVVKSYMAHHVGMSILSAENVLTGGIFQKRFMRNKDVLGASELLYERVSIERNVFEDTSLRPSVQKTEIRRREPESFENISVFNPKMKLITNSEYTLALTDGGISVAAYRDKNVYTRTKDCIERPKGAFFGVGDGKEYASLTLQPDGSNDVTCEFGDGYASYFKTVGSLEAGMKVELHKSLPCEIRSFVLKNTSQQPLNASLISYIEPSLSDASAEAAHPAFNKMFLRLDIDPTLNIITATRSDTVGEPRPYMAIGFVQDIMGCVSFDKEEVLSRPEGVKGLFGRAKDIQRSFIAEPNPCIFMRTEIEIPAKSETEVNLFILCADSRDELTVIVNELRSHFMRQERVQSFDSAPGARLLERLLPQIMFIPQTSEERISSLNSSKLNLRSLWELGLSTDIPLIVLRLNDRNDRDKLLAYLSAYRRLTLCRIKAQLAVVFDDGGRYEREHYTALLQAAKQTHTESLIYAREGILPIDLSTVSAELYELIKAYACHISSDSIIGDDSLSIDESSSKAKIDIGSVSPIEQSVDYEVALGGFKGDSYVINKKPMLPWCHVLSSKQFGTLLSSGSLGFSYAFNSRENRLTPWDNDTSYDNIGERLILKLKNRYYDIISGSAAVFSPYKAEYYFKGDGFSGKVTVGVSDKGMCKKIDVEIKADGDATLAYYCEPCLGVDRKYSHMLKPELMGNTLIMSNAASEADGYMAIASSEKCSFTTSRQGFLSGDWSQNVSAASDTAAAAVVGIGKRNKLSFYLSYAMSKKAAVLMPKLFVEQKSTRENRLEVASDGDTAAEPYLPLANEWLRYQALHARIWARTGFYQCSGAYGFRDQLQDACGIVLENPKVLYTQILRACTKQFTEGDALHWWHSLPTKKVRGIRTRITDDNLWLVYAVCEYVDKTKDSSILHLNVRYSKGLTLNDGENEQYGEVSLTSEKESVYNHCKRAMESRRQNVGKNGLMLIGTGDWNDGFSKLGEKGDGESVWLSEFYILCAERFIKLCEQCSDTEYANVLRQAADELQDAIVKNGRDEKWYLRAYADDGTVIGSNSSRYCKIDSIAQSFAQFSGLDDKSFTISALLQAYEQLADTKRGVIKLFTPAFSMDAEPNPGYIRHYPEGLRENGGQYTHGAVWLGMACIEAGLEEEGLDILNAINPIVRSENGGYERYKTEPYYICGDVYSNKNCYSRGGWSIYTGSAAWYYRAVIQDIFGVKLRDGAVTKSNPLIKTKVTFNGKTVKDE